MSGSTFGNILRITTFGESRGPAIGAVLDGIESGFQIDTVAIQQLLDRRKSSDEVFSTPRKESDRFEIVSGVFEGKTTGSPICIMIRNMDAEKSSDNDELRYFARDGHADLPYHIRYANCDYRGGGRSSGRETAARTAAGAIALQILRSKGVDISCKVSSVGGVRGSEDSKDDMQTWTSLVQMYRSRGETAGGQVTCTASGIPAGIGEPVFDKLDAVISHAVMSIPAVKGIEFGSGFGCEFKCGSENDKAPSSGGVLGGLSDGTSLVFNAAIKPVPTTDCEMSGTDVRTMMRKTVKLNQRHDWCICFRICPVIEAMTAISILDLWYQRYGR
ncbi:MAG: chorismate synthase [Sphaerochaetaceae bacterium]|nr:chorismate synthase [Sphaerochaetaceae bacterium]MDD4007293.1 chorismate synthase [Sphaerochaetaceae bacterium]MDD4396410.1 chorismate synthase [Sphaerochaetaceae bacterium]